MSCSTWKVRKPGRTRARGWEPLTDLRRRYGADMTTSTPVDEHSRLAYAEIHPLERADTEHAFFTSGRTPKAAVLTPRESLPGAG
jgi:hypothetical protein